MPKLTEDDKQFGPVTYGRSSWRAWRLVWSSGGNDDDGRTRNSLTCYAFGWIAQIPLPNLIQPFRIKHQAETWDAATVLRMGRDWYYETHPREYGFSLSDGFLQLFLGAQTHDSSTTQDWACHLPWTQWRFVRLSYYGLAGEHIWTEYEAQPVPSMDRFAEQQAAKEEAPKRVFEFLDFDRQIIHATTLIEEREWRFGTGWFKWLSRFRAPKVCRSLDLQFSSEVGPEKGSWKGGTLGHGIDMLPGELHEAAFRRYCEQEHRSKYNKFRIIFLREIQ